MVIDFDKELRECIPIIEEIVSHEGKRYRYKIRATSVLDSVYLQLKNQQSLNEDPRKRRAFLKTVIVRSIYRRLNRGNDIVSLDTLDLDATVFLDQPEEDQDFAEQQELVSKALDGLPDDLRQIAILNFAEGEAQKAIAEQLCLSRDQIFRKLKKIEEHFERFRESL